MSEKNRSSIRRREFVGALGAGVVTGALLHQTHDAQAQASATQPLKVIDFHNHYVGPSIKVTRANNAPPAARANLAKGDALMANPQALLDSIEVSGVAARVVNTPISFIQDAEDGVPADTIRRINDGMAELTAKNPGKVYGLATVDAYGGEEGALELTRAVRELGLRGVFIDCAKGDLLPYAPEARPTLTAAAELGVPVFIHPVTDPSLHKRFLQSGPEGTRLARGTINAIALTSMLERGVFDELPKLRVVVTTLAIGGVLLAGTFGGGGLKIRSDTPELMRRHVYIDTMGLSPALIAAVVEMLGADHVLAGTDWPIFQEKDIPGRLQASLAKIGLDVAQQQMIASGNTMKLLGIG